MAMYQISSGFGPAECELAVAKFAAFAQSKYPVWLESSTPGQREGIYRSVTLRTSFTNALEDFVGSVLWICRSPYRPEHGRKNWYIQVTRNLEEVPWGGCLRENLVRFETFRSGGHGGQNVNKVETGVRAIDTITGKSVVCTRERSQLANKREALKLLREMSMTEAKIAYAKRMNNLWQQGNRVQRGQPAAVFVGPEFIRKK